MTLISQVNSHFTYGRFDDCTATVYVGKFGYDQVWLWPGQRRVDLPLPGEVFPQILHSG